MFVKKYPALLLLKCRVNRVNGWIANHVFSSSNLRDTFVEISKWILLNSIDFVLQVFNFRKIIRYWALKVTVCIQQWKLKCQENMNFDASGAFCELIGIIVMGPSVMKSKLSVVRIQGSWIWFGGNLFQFDAGYFIINHLFHQTNLRVGRDTCPSQIEVGFLLNF